MIDVPATTTATARTALLMRTVLLAALPGFIALTWLFGFGALLNLFWAALGALGSEALALRLRGRTQATLRDGSALITAALLAAALPPAAPWWLVLFGAGGALLLGKHAFGGLGHNPFNPAMVGYALVLVSFPSALQHWPTALGPIAALQHSLGFGVDGYTGATALDLLRQNQALTMQDLWHRFAQFGSFGARGWEWVNAAFLAGGLLLLQRRIISWHIPVAMLAALALMAAFFYENGSSASGGSPLFHLFSGGTMLTAFFIATDPVSGATSTRGRLLFGAGVGVLAYCMRRWSDYPDGLAFAVLLMNFAAPLLDRCTRPRQRIIAADNDAP